MTAEIYFKHVSAMFIIKYLAYFHSMPFLRMLFIELCFPNYFVVFCDLFVDDLIYFLYIQHFPSMSSPITMTIIHQKGFPPQFEERLGWDIWHINRSRAAINILVGLLFLYVIAFCFVPILIPWNQFYAFGLNRDKYMRLTKIININLHKLMCHCYICNFCLSRNDFTQLFGTILDLMVQTNALMGKLKSWNYNLGTVSKYPGKSFIFEHGNSFIFGF